MNANSPRLRKEVTAVKEFGIERGATYISSNVKIDRSSEAMDENEISISFDPEWKEERIFLKVLVHGDASLYLYEEQNFVRFFYQVRSNPVEQLVYKRYKRPGDISFEYNRNYLNQLFADVNCRELPLSQFENISYTSASLLKWFHNNNLCVNPRDSTISTTRKRKWFSASLLAGGNYLSYRSENSLAPTEGNVQYDSRIGVTFGGEVEFILPFNNNKWSIVGESSTLSYNSSGYDEAGNRKTIDYNTINLFLGIRYYGFLTEEWKALLDAGVTKDIKQAKISSAAGIGVSYSRFTIEFRYFAQRGLYDSYFLLGDKQHFTNMFLALKFRLL